VKKLLSKLRSMIGILRNVNKAAAMVQELQAENASLKAELRIAQSNSDHYRRSFDSTKVSIEAEKSKSKYEDRPEGEGDAKDDVITFLKMDLQNAKKEMRRSPRSGEMPRAGWTCLRTRPG
jgi:predicted RNase H-like nuclease (RuvC/YqgF family)